MALVEQCLRENSYDAELAVVEVLQLMSLGDDGTLVISSLATDGFNLFNHLAHFFSTCRPAAGDPSPAHSSLWNSCTALASQ